MLEKRRDDRRAAGGGSSARSLQREVDDLLRLHEEAARRGAVRAAEAASLAEALAGALDDRALEARPVTISALDESTTVHALNTGLLAMSLARHLAFDEEGILSAGLAGLLHDIGKTRIGDLPAVSPDALSAEEQSVLRSHTVEGARLLLDSGKRLSGAAIVAYEHHLDWRGEGRYPPTRFARAPYALSRIVAVCDAYDVLRSERSFRAALSRQAALAYLEIIAGRSLDPDLVAAFTELARAGLPRVALPASRPEAGIGEIGWLPENGYDPDCEPRPVRL